MLQLTHKQPAQVRPVSNSGKKDMLNNKEGCRGREGEKAWPLENNFNHVDFAFNSSER